MPAQLILEFHGIGSPHGGVTDEDEPMYWLSRETFAARNCFSTWRSYDQRESRPWLQRSHKHPLCGGGRRELRHEASSSSSLRQSQWCIPFDPISIPAETRSRSAARSR